MKRTIVRESGGERDRERKRGTISAVAVSLSDIIFGH